MNRMTQRDLDGISYCLCAGYLDLLEKLAAYEDTGLEPEEIQEAVNLFDGHTDNMPKEIKKWAERGAWHVRKCDELSTKLRKYEQAEVESRLIVLPYKIGDILYEIDDPEYGVIVCKVLWVDAYIGPAGHVEGNEQVNTFVCSVEVVEGHGLGSCYTFGPYDIGRTVFLTREAAEAALRKKENI